MRKATLILALCCAPLAFGQELQPLISNTQEVITMYYPSYIARVLMMPRASADGSCPVTLVSRSEQKLRARFAWRTPTMLATEAPRLFDAILEPGQSATAWLPPADCPEAGAYRTTWQFFETILGPAWEFRSE